LAATLVGWIENLVICLRKLGHSANWIYGNPHSRLCIVQTKLSV